LCLMSIVKQNAKPMHNNKILSYYARTFPKNEYALLKVIVFRRIYLQRVMSIRKKLMLLRELYKQKLALWLIGKANVEELYKIHSQRELLKIRAKSYKSKIKRYAKKGYIEQPVENSRLLYNPYLEAYPLSNATINFREKLLIWIFNHSGIPDKETIRQLKSPKYNCIYHYLERVSDLIIEMVFRGYDRKMIREIAHDLFINANHIRISPNALLHMLESELVIGKTFELE